MRETVPTDAFMGDVAAALAFLAACVATLFAAGVATGWWLRGLKRGW